MSEHVSSLRAEDDLDRERPTNRFWSEVYWIAQFFSLAGFIVSYFWIIGAIADQRGDANRDPTLAWDIGVAPS